ncbi:hypothetical protein CDAR_198681 [Caerostris darwini]|uniref:Uncharacterized protein n=1 Tax=Caerostris darwini TaxID=1538125 RepID=A0AAV4W5K2_9ARAC|nr:hypothetical protein CDAR_198681 [Caerostris darwini]
MHTSQQKSFFVGLSVSAKQTRSARAFARTHYDPREVHRYDVLHFSEGLALGMLSITVWQQKMTVPSQLPFGVQATKDGSTLELHN